MHRNPNPADLAEALEALRSWWRRASVRRWFWIAIIILPIFIFGSVFVSMYTDWLWFTHDAKAVQVWLKGVRTSWALFGIGFIVAGGALAINDRIGARGNVVYDSVADSYSERIAGTMLGDILGRSIWRPVLFGLLGGLIGGGILSRYVYEWWWATASVPFGIEDPLFGKDLEFFVFRLPFLTAAVDFVLGLLIILALITAGWYALGAAMARAANAAIAQPQARAHLHCLIGGALLSYAGRLWLVKHAIAYEPGELFTGPGYAGEQWVVVVGVIVWLIAAVGVATIVNGWVGRPFRVPVYGVGGLVAVAFVGLWIYPALVQQFKVRPNQLSVESPYAERAIAMTRFAYALNSIEVRQFAVRPEPTPQEVATADETLQNMRLWDPAILRTVIDNRQTLRQFYNFNDVDIDRYNLEDTQRMVMLSARNLQVEGLESGARTWVNQHLRYTHGNGLIMIPVDRTTSRGEPYFFIRDLPPRLAPALSEEDERTLQVEQPRIYFSDYLLGSQGETGYVIVDTTEVEYDYPAEQGADAVYRWTGEGGVPIGGLLARMAYASYFDDFSILISNTITDQSQILYRRDIVDRAATVYPLFSFDSDPYLVLLDAKCYWILDAYAVSGRVPYSQQIAPDANYIRNVAKIVIDAYTGEMTAYATSDAADEPMLRAAQKIFPGMVRPFDEAPAEVVEHFRYPEDLFNAQSQILTQYHVEEPRSFLSREDAWEIPSVHSTNGVAAPIVAYFVQVRLPGSDRDAFMLMRPFVPRDKQNMIGWMAAHCDPEQYGQLVLYQFPANTQTQGPSQMEAAFNADETVADINRQLNNEQSRIVPGNLLVIPLGSSILYVRPLFLEDREVQIPELRKVILGLQERVVVADTYDQALQRLFEHLEPGDIDTGAPPPAPPASGPAQPVTAPGELEAAIAEALGLLSAGEAALREGDLARYAELNRRADTILREAIGR